ncbi:MAG: hypothetical protein ABIM99_01830 [Candidatus Dojkabacteria bacterium]
MDPAVKQYLIFSLVIGVIAGVLINFILIEGVKGSFAYGFPIVLNGVEGIANFLYRIINSLILGALLTIPIYLGLKYLQTRS